VRIAVVGAGQMGSGIAQVAAASGADVILHGASVEDAMAAAIAAPRPDEPPVTMKFPLSTAAPLLAFVFASERCRTIARPLLR